MKAKCFHVVRRFEPLGGMESYVWKLTHNLQKLGVDITIVCEEASEDASLPVIRLGSVNERRRWKAMRKFRFAVSKYFASLEEDENRIIHSHERTLVHNVTTIHGPLMRGSGYAFPVKYLLSKRVRFWCEAEENEILGNQVKAVLPVSALWGEKITELYPRARIFSPVPPGLDFKLGKPFDGVSELVKLVFVGREWRRKGLPFAMDICSELIKKGILCSLDIYGASGFSSDQLPSYISYKGDRPSIPFDEYDLLIHPAISEPYGMVVPEALGAGCRALVSDRVGAKMLNHPLLMVRQLDLGVDAWVDGARDLLQTKGSVDFTFSTWMDLARFHSETVYPAVLMANNHS